MEAIIFSPTVSRWGQDCDFLDRLGCTVINMFVGLAQLGIISFSLQKRTLEIKKNIEDHLVQITPPILY